MKNLIQLIAIPYLLLKEKFFWFKTNKQILPGQEFYYFGKSLGWKLLFKGTFSLKLLLNPVSIVRYFEYDHAVKSFTNLSHKKINILDISSPYLFGFYITLKNNVSYTYINPDKNDLARVKKFSYKLLRNKEYKTGFGDATNLDFPDKTFDAVISISVIEHIGKDGDLLAIKEMWRVLKPGGILILTFPVSRMFFNEYTDTDTYGLNIKGSNGKYFFQRYYDEAAIEKRLLNNISDFTILTKQIFGETEEGFFDSYSERWQKKGLFETVKDPYLISNYFTYLNSFDEIKKTAVLGLTLRKNL